MLGCLFGVLLRTEANLLRWVAMLVDSLIGWLRLRLSLLLVPHVGSGFSVVRHVRLLARLLRLVKLLSKQVFMLLGPGCRGFRLLVHRVEFDSLLKSVNLLHIELLSGLVLIRNTFFVRTLAPVLAQNHQRVAYRVEGVLHHQLLVIGRCAFSFVLL